MQTVVTGKKRPYDISLNGIRGMCRIALLLAAFMAITWIQPCQSNAYREKPGDVIETSCGEENSAGKKILITYDTEHGSTSTIVVKIGEVLCAAGFQVDVVFAPHVDDISRYDAVIAGSPIYEFKWLPGTRRFLKKYRSELADKQVALFIVCTYLKDENDTPERRADAVDLYVDPVLETIPEVEPVSIGILSGEIVYAELSPLDRFRMKLFGFPEGDFRNWDKISAWAEELSGILKQ